MTVPMTESPPREVEDLEIELLLEGIWRRYGYDFREYDRGFIRERVHDRLREEGLLTASQLLERVLRKPDTLRGFVDGGGGKVDSFFRPAKVWRALRRKALPLLRTYPSVRAWALGCSSEGDLCSLLLLLQEELSRSYKLYATDLHERRPRRARPGSFRRAQVRILSKQFAAAGGRRSLSDHLGFSNGKAHLLPSLRRRIVFASHNLATDASFNDFHLILARNTMKGLSGALRARVYGLIHESLVRLGFLMIGAGESLEESPYARCYAAVDRGAGLYQKKAE